MNPTLLDGVFTTLLAVSWRAAWLIGALLVIRWWVRGRVPAQVWYCSWIVLALRLLIPFSVSAAWSPFNLARPHVAVPIPAPIAVPAPIPAPASVAAIDSRGSPIAEQRPISAPAAASPVHGWQSTVVWAWVWLGIAAALIGLNLTRVFRFRLALRGATVADDRTLATVVAEAARSGIAPPRCLITKAVDVPALFGILRPTILLPREAVERLGMDELRLVVRHELAHCRRRDLLAQQLLELAKAIHWFNPLVWIAARVARADCELACDEHALGRDVSERTAEAYGKALLKVVALTVGNPRSRPALGIFEARRQLAFRVKMIARGGSWTKSRVFGGVCLIAAVAAVSVTCELRADTKRASPRPAASVVAAAPAAEADHLAAQQHRVEELERELLAYKEAHRLSGLDALRDMMADSLRNATRDVERYSSELGRLDRQIQQVKEAQARKANLADLPFIAEVPGVGALHSQYLDLAAQLNLLSEKYFERHPRVSEIQSRIQATLQQLNGEIEAACRRIEANRRTVAAALEAAQQQLTKSSDELRELERVAVGYRDKQRALELQERVLQNLVAVPHEAPVVSAPNQYEFKSVVVNVAGTSGSRYLKASFVVSGSDASLGTVFQERRPELADATLAVLSLVTLADVDRPEIRSTLRDQLVAAYNKQLGQNLAEQVYFSEFVVQ